MFALSSHARIVLAVAAFVLIFRLGATPIYILDEAKNAQCAREMLASNNFVVPMFNNEIYTDKPALTFYFMMIAYKIFGFTPFAARIGSVIVGLLTMLITYSFARKYLGERVGLTSLIVLTCSLHFMFEFRLAVPDPYLIFFNTIVLILLYTSVVEDKAWHFYVAALAAGLGTLLKGPVAVALPGLCFVIFLFVNNSGRFLSAKKLLIALGIYLIVSVPWYWAVNDATGGYWVKEFFFKHNLSRFSEPMEGHGFFFLTVPLFVFIAFLPFALFWKASRPFSFTKSFSGLLGYCLLIMLIYVIFFTVSATKLPNYAMPCYPFVAILLAKATDSFTGGKIWQKIALVIIALALPLGAFSAMRNEAALFPYRSYAFLLFMLPLGLLGYFLLNPKDKNFLGILSIYAVFNLLFLGVLYPMVYRQNPVRKTLALFEPGQKLIAYQIHNPGYNFYLSEPLERAHNLEELASLLRKYPGANIVTRESSLNSLSALNLTVLAKEKDTFESPVTVILQQR